MAVQVKKVTDERSGTSAAATYQPASGKAWWFTTCRMEWNVAGGTNNWYQWQRSDGTTHTGLYTVGADWNMVTAFEYDASNNSAWPIAYSGPRDLWFTNSHYLRCLCGDADSSNWWQVMWFGVEADI